MADNPTAGGAGGPTLHRFRARILAPAVRVG